MEHEQLTHAIIGEAIEVHRRTGPELLGSSYEECLSCELDIRGVRHERQAGLPLIYRDRRLDVGYRIDMIVSGVVVIELKAIERLLPIHEAQLLTCMKLSGTRVGLLINFCVPVPIDGVIRRVL